MPATRELLDAIRQVIREEVSSRLDNLEVKVNELAKIKETLSEHKQCINDIENALEDIGRQIDEFKEKSIPDLEKKYKDITTNICLRNLDLDTHRRKWSLILNGIQGEPGELERDTRTKVREFAKQQLKVTGADTHKFGACHRLSQKENAGIIICFTDLSDRNSWLSNAKNLKNTGSKISVSPDLHPTLRKLKSNILNKRKDLPPEQKRLSQVHYMPRWPYICLKIRGQTTIIPDVTKESIVNSYLDMED